MITLHTLTQGRHPQWLKEALHSVPDGVRHVVLHCDGDFAEKRWAGLRFGDLVGAVDDDDRLRPGVVEACAAALDATGAGVAFTYEAQIDARGCEIPVAHRSYSTRDVAMHPNVLHHFALMRRECLADEVLEHARRFHQGSIDWLSKAWVALKHGAVQVPMVGYDWRVHGAGMSRSTAEVEGVALHMRDIRRLTLSWLEKDAPIRQFLPG